MSVVLVILARANKSASWFVTTEALAPVDDAEADLSTTVAAHIEMESNITVNTLAITFFEFLYSIIKPLIP